MKILLEQDNWVFVSQWNSMDLEGTMYQQDSAIYTPCVRQYDLLQGRFIDCLISLNDNED